MSSSGHLGHDIMPILSMGDLTAWRAVRTSFFGAGVALLLGSAEVFAQSTPGEPLTLEAAIERALAANPTIAAGRLRRAVDLAGVAVAAERPNPDVAVEIAKETPKQSVAVSVPFELGGKRVKRIAVGQATLGVGDAELEATIAQVRNDVRRSYFEARVAEARLDVLRELGDVATRVHATAQTRFDRGDAPRLEVLQADLARNTAEAELTAAGGAAVAARARLNALLGLPLDALRTLTSALDPGGDIVTGAVVERARTGSAELHVLDRRIDEQRARVMLARALRVPDAVPSATLTHDAQPEFTYGWRAGVAITLPLFTTHKAGIAVEDATLAQLVAQREAALVRVVGEVTAAAATAEAQRQASLRYRDVILPQARQVEQLAQESYRLGQTGLVALLQALQASRDVRLRSLDTVSQFHAALADLERAIGAPLP
jgi:cobalt-zinc-cadmium efflux system outer membrane protein